MRGIQLFHYKYLLESLHRLKPAEAADIPAEHTDMILRQEEKLKDIYNNYQLAMGQVSAIIKQFEEQQLAIRRLISHHKGYKRSAGVKNTFPDKP